ncbi:MAG: alkaline phosphatase family protein [Verrucomicrobia bacterium]|nr:alkaline phosphatase family protein [Verrucomicrobiota bacterium]
MSVDLLNSTFGFSRLRPGKLRRSAAVLAAAIAGVLVGQTARALADGDRPVDHVLLISVDGMHQSDLAWYVRTHPWSTLAALARHGVDYSNASTPFPSDSFPGMVGQVTGGNPSSTGIYYDDTWNHDVFPAGTTNCAGPAPGGECAYTEFDDKNQGALDAGQGIVPAPGPDPWADILHMTGNPLDVINPLKLPVNPSTCKPIYPNQYLHVNTIFNVADNHHLLTAWSDKHPAYQIFSGPSGDGVDDYFTPEINSSANPKAPTDPSQPDWTTDNLFTQQYDGYKVQAVIHWINGHRHDGSGNPGTPAIFGMNFQTVSTGQKLPTSRTEGDLSGTAKGGDLADGITPGPVLSNALDFVDRSLGKMVKALEGRCLLTRTAIIVSAKHGQSPMKLTALNRINDGQIIAALNAAWNKSHQGGNPNATPLVALGTDDDGMLLWLNDRSDTATDYARKFLTSYDDPTASIDGKPVTSAGLLYIYAGAAAAKFIGVPESDPRVPDVVGIAQYGVVYTSHKSKIAEHGGDHREDRNVPILLVLPESRGGRILSTPVETTQIAPTILRLLGLNPRELQAVNIEGTRDLPYEDNDLGGDSQ